MLHRQNHRAKYRRIPGKRVFLPLVFTFALPLSYYIALAACLLLQPVYTGQFRLACNQALSFILFANAASYFCFMAFFIFPVCLCFFYIPRLSPRCFSALNRGKIHPLARALPHKKTAKRFAALAVYLFIHRAGAFQSANTSAISALISASRAVVFSLSIVMHSTSPS